MQKTTGKTAKACTSDEEKCEITIGKSLKRLRLLSGLKQTDIASCLGISQTEISRMERGENTSLFSIKKYIEALGGSLHVDGVFSTDTSLGRLIRDAATNYRDISVPLLADDLSCAQRDVVLSIHPYYTDKILSGDKTVELRRRFPVHPPQTRAYIYSTSPVQAMVGVVEIKNVYKLPVYQIWSNFENQASIKKRDFEKYFEGSDFGYALVFNHAKPLSRPIPLIELRERFGFTPPQSFLYVKHSLRKALQDE